MRLAHDVVHLTELVGQVLLEVFEGQHDHGDVVERFICNGRLHHLLHQVSTCLMDRLIFVVIVLFGCNPALLEYFSVANFVEYAVTYK